MDWYSIGQIIAMLAAMVITVIWARKYEVSYLKAFLITVVSDILTFAGVMLLTWIESGFQSFGSQNIVRVYAFLVPIVLFEAKVFRIDFIRCLEFQSVAMPLCYGFGHFACLTRMCCYGFHYQEGTAGYAVANALTKTDQLPMQIFESVSALLIFVAIAIIAAIIRYKPTGYLFAFFQIVFGATRFFWEFLRDNEKLIVFGPMNGAINDKGEQAVWGISNLALWAVATFVAGVILAVGLKIYHNKTAAKQKQISAA